MRELLSRVLLCRNRSPPAAIVPPAGVKIVKSGVVESILTWRFLTSLNPIFNSVEKLSVQSEKTWKLKLSSRSLML